MNPRIYQEFERVCSARNINGSVLEIGAVPSRMSLLCMKSLENATEKIGINLDGPHQFRDFRIHKGNANSMDMFADDRFDVVLSNAVLEHDRHFWKTIAEIRRVTKPGGFVMIGAPGYKYYRAEKYKSVLEKIPLVCRLKRFRYLNPFFSTTVTVHVHNYPGDYYRFSPQAFEEVFFEGFDHVEVRALMLPPRIVGFGTKK